MVFLFVCKEQNGKQSKHTGNCGYQNISIKIEAYQTSSKESEFIDHVSYTKEGASVNSLSIFKNIHIGRVKDSIGKEAKEKHQNSYIVTVFVSNVVIH